MKRNRRNLISVAIITWAALLTHPVAANMSFCPNLLAHTETEPTLVVEATLFHISTKDHPVLFTPATDFASRC